MYNIIQTIYKGVYIDITKKSFFTARFLRGSCVCFPFAGTMWRMRGWMITL